MKGEKELKKYFDVAFKLVKQDYENQNKLFPEMDFKYDFDMRSKAVTDILYHVMEQIELEKIQKIQSKGSLQVKE